MDVHAHMILTIRILYRSFRSIFRHGSRSLIVIAMVGLSLSVAVTMLQANWAAAAKILGMAGHQPPFFLGGKQMTILGVYETGSAQADQWVLLPLTIVQQLYGKPGQVNEAYVIVEDATKRSSTVDKVKEIVGDAGAVQALGE